MIEFNNDHGKRREVVSRGTRLTQSFDVVQGNFSFQVRVFKEVAGQSSTDSTSANEAYLELMAKDGSRIKYNLVGNAVSMNVIEDGEAAEQLNEEFKSLNVSPDFWKELQTGSFEKALQLLSL